MLRRFCTRHVTTAAAAAAATHRRSAPLSRAITLHRSSVCLSRRGESEGDAGHRLAAEVQTTWNESQLMTADLQQHTHAASSAPSKISNDINHNNNNNNNSSNSSGGGGAEADWAEPTLADLDRSIPQVDGAFIADLIRSRTRRRQEFLHQKVALKERVDDLTKHHASSVADAARYPIIGASSSLRASSSSSSSSSSSGNTNGSSLSQGGENGMDAPVVVAPEVLAQLTDAERDVLLSARPEYDDGFVLLDCRTVNEVTSWGMIEGAKVLPAHEMFDGFHRTPEDFAVEFGFAKPRPEQRIICYCQYGPRSLMAAQILSWMGYPNVLHLRDGYYEWSKQYNLLLRRWMLHDKESGNEIKRQVAFQAGLELQREIAPEFNALPQQEASRYRLDTTRSRGTLCVGDGLRAEAYREVEKLVAGMEPPLLPGVLGDAERAAGSSAAVGTRQDHMQRFLQETTGMNMRSVESQPAMGLAEAQEKVLDAFTRRDGGSHAAPPPRHR